MNKMNSHMENFLWEIHIFSYVNSFFIYVGKLLYMFIPIYNTPSWYLVSVAEG